MYNQIVTNLRDLRDREGKNFEKAIKINLFVIYEGLSLKRGFGGCGHGFDGYDGLGRLGGFDGLGGFGRFDGFSRFGRFNGLGRFCGFDGFSRFGGFDGQLRLSLKGFSVSFTLLLKVLHLLVSYPPS